MIRWRHNGGLPRDDLAQSHRLWIFMSQFITDPIPLLTRPFCVMTLKSGININGVSLVVVLLVTFLNGVPSEPQHPATRVSQHRAECVNRGILNIGKAIKNILTDLWRTPEMSFSGITQKIVTFEYYVKNKNTYLECSEPVEKKSGQSNNFWVSYGPLKYVYKW